MRLLVTGLGGTLAPKVARAAAARGLDICGWDRARWPTDDPATVATAWHVLQPDAVLHLALGPVAWAEALAAQASAGLHRPHRLADRRRCARQHSVRLPAI
jgi:dTDP-4-dehydrorhamnose reductase